jgi:hypothetical protein
MAGHTRHILLTLLQSLIINEDSSGLMGSLPFEGFRILLVYKGHIIQSAAIDDNAYYFDHIRPGSYILRVEFAQDQSIDFPVSVHGPLTIRNIDLRDLTSSTN